MKEEKPEAAGPFVAGEHLLMNFALAIIAERRKADDPIRAKLEQLVRENLATVVREGNEKGDLLGAFKRYEEHLELVLSQKEAQKALAEKATGQGSNEAAVRAALKAGDLKLALERKVFYLLRWEHYRDLQHPDIRKLLEVARETGDQRLLVRLGRALQEKAKRGPEDVEVGRLDFVLVEWWVKGPQGQLGLCRLTDKALMEFCSLALNQKNLTMAAVRKVRQRWKLKKGPKPWLKKVEKTAEGIFVS